MRHFVLRHNEHYDAQRHAVFDRYIKFLKPSVVSWLNLYGVQYSLANCGATYVIQIEDDRQAAHFKLVWL